MRSFCPISRMILLECVSHAFGRFYVEPASRYSKASAVKQKSTDLHISDTYRTVPLPFTMICFRIPATYFTYNQMTTFTKPQELYEWSLDEKIGHNNFDGTEGYVTRPLLATRQPAKATILIRPAWLADIAGGIEIVFEIIFCCTICFIFV